MKHHFLCALLPGLLALPLGAVDIVRGGAPAAVIEIAPEATAADRFAANELSSLLKQMTGAELPVVTGADGAGDRIRIGAAAGLADWRGADEVRIATPDDHTLLIAGEGTRGTLYAVYTLSEELGVRFYAPDCTVLPHGGDLKLECVDYRYRPPFAYREGHGELINANPLLSARWRLNGAMYRGGLTDELGGSYPMDMTHSLINQFLKPADFFAAHPEWYSLNAATGERRPTQLCLSNPEARAELIREVRAKLAANPGLPFVAIGGADNNQYCECADCQALVAAQGTTAAPYLMAADEVARAIRADYPKTQVMFQAYWMTERPPEKLTLEPNVAITLAILDRNHGLPIRETPRYLPYLERWSNLVGGKIYIWDYWATFGNFLLPAPNLDTLGPTMRDYAAEGVQGVFMQLPFGTLADFGELRSWLFARLAWNPQLDADKLTEEFSHAYYGDAAGKVLEYIALEETARKHQPGTFIGLYGEETKHWLTPADVRRMRELLDAALAAAAATPETHDRVRKLRTGLLLVEALRYGELKAAGNPMPSRPDVIDELEALGREFKCGAYKEWDDFVNLIKRLREMTPPPPATTGTDPVTIGPEQLTGSASGAPDAGYPFMPFGTRAVKFTVPETAAGIWDVAVTVRTVTDSPYDPAAAYIGIYTPSEIVRLPVAATALAPTETTLELGRRSLPAGSTVWAMAGVTGLTGPVEIRRITLTPPRR